MIYVVDRLTRKSNITTSQSHLTIFSPTHTDSHQHDTYTPHPLHSSADAQSRSSGELAIQPDKLGTNARRIYLTEYTLQRRGIHRLGTGADDSHVDTVTDVQTKP